LFKSASCKLTALCEPLQDTFKQHTQRFIRRPLLLARLTSKLKQHKMISDLTQNSDLKIPDYCSKGFFYLETLAKLNVQKQLNAYVHVHT
jgi:hypothetical protein